VADALLSQRTESGQNRDPPSHQIYGWVTHVALEVKVERRLIDCWGYRKKIPDISYSAADTWQE